MIEELIATGARSVSSLDFSASGCIDNEAAVAPAGSALPGEDDWRHTEDQFVLLRETARAEAYAEARRQCELEARQKAEVERQRVGALVIEFRREREQYFREAEAQVVHLALAVARTILCREVDADPGYLFTIVQRALARAAAASHLTLQVCASQVEQWTALFAETEGTRLSVVGQESIGVNRCILESRLGRVELGIEPQLEEVELALGRGASALLGV